MASQRYCGERVSVKQLVLRSEIFLAQKLDTYPYRSTPSLQYIPMETLSYCIYGVEGKAHGGICVGYCRRGIYYIHPFSGGIYYIPPLSLPRLRHSGEGLCTSLKIGCILLVVGAAKKTRLWRGTS